MRLQSVCIPFAMRLLRPRDAFATRLQRVCDVFAMRSQRACNACALRVFAMFCNGMHNYALLRIAIQKNPYTESVGIWSKWTQR
eukprot:11221073-Lingulodinium_polyedra.AAC.1